MIAYSREVGVMKPDPDAYVAVCDLLEVEPHEVVLLDDLERCVEGAEAVGMTAVLYRDNEQAIAEIERHLARADASGSARSRRGPRAGVGNRVPRPTSLATG